MTQPVPGIGTDPSSIPPLLNAADLASFQASDPSWFLAAAGETVRWDICQWHIYPNITVTESIPIQPDGTIMLPSVYVTGVEAVFVGGLQQDPSTYDWYQAGYIKRFHRNFFQWPLWPLESEHPFREYPSALARHAIVTYSHGYDKMPPAVNAVALELANRAMEMPSGVANNISSGPYSIGLGALGVVPTDEQRRRCGPYSLVRF
jgi:hypothetical protein